MDDHIHLRAVATEVLVDSIVYSFPHEVVKPGAIMNVSDVHPGALAHRLEPLQDRDALAPVVGHGWWSRLRDGHICHGGFTTPAVLRQPRTRTIPEDAGR